MSTKRTDDERAERRLHTGKLHNLAKNWLMDRANPEEDGGLGMFADTRFCLDLTALLRKVERAALKRGSPST